MGTNGKSNPDRSKESDSVDVWKQYKENPSQELRNKLILMHYGVLLNCAKQQHIKIRGVIPVEELVSYGLDGLIDAINAFDPKRGIRFEVFCAKRVWGSIIDGIRGMDWIPRLVRSRTRKTKSARNRLKLSLGRDPTPEEIREELNLSPEQYERESVDSQPIHTTSLSSEVCGKYQDGREISITDVIEDETGKKPGDEADRQDLRKFMTRGLDQRSKLIIILYHFEGLSMGEIGEVLCIGASRVSQMHTAAIDVMKSNLALKDLLNKRR